MKKRSKTTLKPCPWCGKQPNVETYYPIYPPDETYFSAGCHRSRCKVSPRIVAETKDEAIAAWNTRAKDLKQ